MSGIALESLDSSIAIFSYSDSGGNDLVAAKNALLTADANAFPCSKVLSSSTELKSAFEEAPAKFFIALHHFFGFEFFKWLTWDS